MGSSQDNFLAIVMSFRLPYDQNQCIGVFEDALDDEIVDFDLELISVIDMMEFPDLDDDEDFIVE